MSDVVVVTGAARGIGRATALTLARRGLTLALVGRSLESLAAVAAEVASLGGTARLYAGDVAVEGDVARIAEALLAELGAPRVVVHNAGIVHRGAKVHETTVESFDRVVAVNLRGPYLLTRALLPAMLAAGRGRMVYISSISATLGSPGAASYAASKWGLVGLMKSVAEELRGTGLTAVAVLPGSVDTDMLAGSGFAPQMSADDVAALIAYAAFDAPAALTGSAIEMFG